MSALSLSAAAQAETDGTDAPTLPSAFREMWESLPEALRESLPADTEATAAGFASLGEAETVWTAIVRIFGDGLADAARLFLRLCGVLLLRSLWENFRSAFSAPGLAAGMGLICRTVLCGMLLQAGRETLESVGTYFQALQGLETAFLPLIGTLFALGGNVTAAAVSQVGVSASLSVISYVSGEAVVPFCALCLAFGVVGVFGGGAAERLRAVTGKLRKWFLTGLSFLMLLFSAAMGAQTVLSVRSDSLGFKTARFALANSVPYVGSGVADLLRTAAAEVSWLRGVGGVAGLWLLLYALLPGAVSLLTVRTVWSVGADMAAFLDCPEEGRMMGEIGELCGLLLAVLLLSALTFFFALLLLLHSGTAMG